MYFVFLLKFRKSICIGIRIRIFFISIVRWVPNYNMYKMCILNKHFSFILHQATKINKVNWGIIAGVDVGGWANIGIGIRKIVLLRLESVLVSER